MRPAPAPLSKVRVLDLTQVYSGPYCTFLLAQAGAEVIKVEPPVGEGLRARGGVAATPFAMFNANKRSITLDLKSDAGRSALRRLAATADVVVENFRPGVMAGLGLGPKDLRRHRPELIYAALSGYGATGPYAQFPALDITIQAMLGVIASTGEPDQPPVKAGAAMADILGGVHLYAAIVSALYRRSVTGLGGVIDVAMADCVYPTLASNLGPAQNAGPGFISRTGNRHGGGTVSPYNVYRTADGHVAIICTTQGHWLSLTTALGLDAAAADPRLATNALRAQNVGVVDALVGQALAARRKRDVFQILSQAGVPCGAVLELPEVMADPHLHARGLLKRIDHPQYGPLVVQTSALRFEDTALPPYEPSRPLGADTEAILGELEA